ncbi:hypothetical protein Tco_0007754 [Tanacetum coccineum]
MSRSEPGEMAPESSKPVVIPKLYMYIYTSTLTLEELNQAIKEFCILTDLRPRLPPPDLTMNKLSDDVIGVYVEHLDQGGMRIPFSTFLLNVIKYFRIFYKLCKQGHWFSFENKFGGRAKKCFKEITSSLKGWKKKFFLIDRRVIPDPMPWRHIDTDVRYDFPISYNESDVECIVERIILLRKPPQPLLYMRGLTMDCRHTELSHVIKDPKGQGELIPDNEHPLVRITALFPVGSVILEKNARQKSVEKPYQKIAEACEKKEKQALEKDRAKRACKSSSAAPKKKKAQRNAGLTSLESEGTIFAAPINQSIPKPLHSATRSKQKEIETSIVDLSEHTQEPTLPLMVGTLEEQFVQEDDRAKNIDVSDDWSLRSDIRISYYRACKEMISHLATPSKDAVLRSWTNYEAVRRTYQSLGQSILSQAELLRRHEQLNHDYIYLCNHSDVQVEELNRLRTECMRARSSNKGLSKNLVLLDSAHAQCSDSWLGGLSLGCTEEEIVVVMPNTSNLDIEGSKVSLDIPPPATDDQVGPSVQNVNGDPTNPNPKDNPLVYKF